MARHLTLITALNINNITLVILLIMLRSCRTKLPFCQGLVALCCRRGQLPKGKYGILSMNTSPGLDSLKMKASSADAKSSILFPHPESQHGVWKRELIFNELHFVKYFTYIVSFNHHYNPWGKCFVAHVFPGPSKVKCPAHALTVHSGIFIVHLFVCLFCLPTLYCKLWKIEILSLLDPLCIEAVLAYSSNLAYICWMTRVAKTGIWIQVSLATESVPSFMLCCLFSILVQEVVCNFLLSPQLLPLRTIP